ncbi:MAG: NfeD family protein [Dehalococcoidales bacterium]
MAEFFESYAIWIIWIIFGLFFLFFMVTAPCHAVLLLPLLGLPLFWLLPLGYALSINIAAWLATPFLYRVIRKAMIRPVKDGFQSLVGTTAEVVSKSEIGRSAKYLVRVQGEGELWSAYSTDTLQPGEAVNIVAVKGIGVVVKRAENGHDEPGNVKTKSTGARNNERHCH